MLQTLCAAVLFLAPCLPVQEEGEKKKTLEERLTELEKKLSELEARKAELEKTNQDLESQIAEVKERNRQAAERVADAWVKRYSEAVKFTEEQAAKLRELWYEWTLKDFEAPPKKETWAAREDVLRKEIDKKQAALLAKAVLAEQERTAVSALGSLLRLSTIGHEPADAVKKKVFAKIAFAEDALILQAHPDNRVDWYAVVAAVKACMHDLAEDLDEEELKRLEETVAKYGRLRANKKSENKK